MIKLVKFDNETTYMFPNGDIATPEVIVQQFPAITHFTHVLEVNGDVCQAVMNLKAMRNIHNIDEVLTEEEAILAMENLINNPVVQEVEVSADERIASALEFQNLLAM